MELRVVGVLVILHAVVSDDVGDWAAVDCEQQLLPGTFVGVQGYKLLELCLNLLHLIIS